MPTRKTPVIQHLYDLHRNGGLPGGVAYQNDVVAAIRAVGNGLGTNNPANFLKDIIRKDTANEHWPEPLTAARVTARQRYAEGRVLQFVDFLPGQVVPFPDNYLPGPLTSVHSVQSATIPFAARQLGRKEESWLMQVVVALRLVETHLAMFSPLRDRLRDLTHLQMSMKTQPEIDAVYLVSHGSSRVRGAGIDLFTFITCEAKQIGERILEDQIREQVAQAFHQTRKLDRPDVRAVKPLAVQVRHVETPAGWRRGVYIVEFQRIRRSAFTALFAQRAPDDERLYRMPLEAVSTAIYHLTPPVRGVNA